MTRRRVTCASYSLHPYLNSIFAPRRQLFSHERPPQYGQHARKTRSTPISARRTARVEPSMDFSHLTIPPQLKIRAPGLDLSRIDETRPIRTLHTLSWYEIACVIHANQRPTNSYCVRDHFIRRGGLVATLTLSSVRRIGSVLVRVS